ncbi:MAG TPA: hypothetical protein VHW09_24460 [Bryobacteraceae bacterium]|jgi:hypothetical protein|nr:hypothetical protein [Bryobacteraceae bacterium]
MKMRSYWVLVLAAFPALLQAQFSSGSTGSDGALNITSGTVTLDPTMLPNQCANNVCNFSSIMIGPNVTVVLTSQLWRNSSVVWLSQGAVSIQGTIHADGSGGAAMNTQNPGLTRFPAAPGPGGFPGGVGGYLSQPSQPGAGYGGGAAGTPNGINGGPGVYSYYNNQLTPLLGGPGGGGGYQDGGVAGGNGGAGGGAIRIVSSVSISVTGKITANAGGLSCGIGSGVGCGGNGSGGVIHLIAPAVSGTGTLQVNAFGNQGIIEVSSASNTIPNDSSHFSGPYVSAGLYSPPLPTGVPSVQVTSVAGVTAPAYPTANPMVPDVTINSSAPVTVAIATQNIPTNSVITLYLTAENAPDSVAICGSLTGTVASATATCTAVNFPSGVTITNILAVW